MSRLTDEEKHEFLRAAKENPPTRQTHRALSGKEYLEFLNFANRFTRCEKPVDFCGNNWKL